LQINLELNTSSCIAQDLKLTLVRGRILRRNIYTNLENRIRYVGVAAACVGVLVGTAALTKRFHPSNSPFRSDIITLVNDVGEKIVVLKTTIKPDQKAGKELLESLAKAVKEDLKNASKPVQRSEISSCIQADAKANEAESTQSAANSWRQNMFGESLAKMYDEQAQETRSSAAESEIKCQSEFAALKKERNQLMLDASASKQLISLSGTPGAYQKYVPTYSYKLLVTDVNGKSNVIPGRITCLNENAIYVFSREKRKKIAPHSFVAFSKPDQMTIVTSAKLLPELSRFGGSVMPTEDAVNYASQEICKYKGHVGVEIDLAKAS
jgi:hypothetical protein